MDTAQTVIVTFLAICAAVMVCSLFIRMANLDDDLWFEPVVLLLIGLLIYLVAR